MENLSVLFTAPDRVETQRIDDDIGQLRARDVLVKTHYSVISAATELACLSGSQRWFPFPGTPGYAAVGEVIEAGGEIADVAPGDMVHFWGGHKQYSLVDTARPMAICLKTPEGLPLELAPFTRMAIIAMTSLRISNIELGDYVGVVGLGTVGNFAAQLAGLQGGTVIGLDLSKGRAERARLRYSTRAGGRRRVRRGPSARDHGWRRRVDADRGDWCPGSLAAGAAAGGALWRGDPAGHAARRPRDRFNQQPA